MLVFAESNRQPVLAKSGEPDLIKMDVAFGAERFNFCLLRKLRFNCLNRLPGPQRDAREEIIRHSHAGNDMYIDAAFIDEQLTHRVVIIRPM